VAGTSPLLGSKTLLPSLLLDEMEDDDEMEEHNELAVEMEGQIE
jgi:hypothetical protein